MSAPKWVLDGIHAMQAERTDVASRLSKLDIAIENLSLVYGVNGHETAVTKPERRAKPKRQAAPSRPVGDDSSEAQQRRDAVLQAIGRSEVGLTIGELRKQTPKMDGGDRSNAIQQLKAAGKIRRVGNTWEKTKD